MHSGSEDKILTGFTYPQMKMEMGENFSNMLCIVLSADLFHRAEAARINRGDECFWFSSGKRAR